MRSILKRFKRLLLFCSITLYKKYLEGLERKLQNAINLLRLRRPTAFKKTYCVQEGTAFKKVTYCV